MYSGEYELYFMQCAFTEFNLLLYVLRGDYRETMKKPTTSILLALFSATIFTPIHVEASWLSKTWKKIEKSWNESGTHNTSTETSSPSESAMYLPSASD